MAAPGKHHQRAGLPQGLTGENVQKAALNLASVEWILKRALGRAGVRDLVRYGAHSLRAGFVTTAFAKGVPEFSREQAAPQPRTPFLSYMYLGIALVWRSRNP